MLVSYKKYKHSATLDLLLRHFPVTQFIAFDTYACYNITMCIHLTLSLSQSLFHEKILIFINLLVQTIFKSIATDRRHLRDLQAPESVIPQHEHCPALQMLADCRRVQLQKPPRQYLSLATWAPV
jgi:hypothetical protein